MGKITITGLDDDLTRRLDALPNARRDAIEAELRETARFLIDRSDRSNERRHLADRIAAKTPAGVPQTDSVDLLRQDRER
jgi:antitoxin FitA